MLFRRDIDADLYSEYGAVVRTEHMNDAMRSGIAVVMSLNTLFILFDLLVFRDRFFDLLCIRLIWNALMASMYYTPVPEDASKRAILACHITGLGLVAVIAGAGGVDSGYAPGLMLLFLGLPVLIPMSAGEAARVVTLSLVTLGALPILTGTSIEFGVWGMNMFFPTAAAIECVASCAVLEGMRIGDYLRRKEIQTARDELAQLDQAKSRFSANVHHELRTPLTLILAPLDAIRSGDFGVVPKALAETVETMHANGRRLYKLISNLLDLSKLESMSFKIQRAPIDLSDVAADLVTASRGMAERKDIDLCLEGFDEFPSVNADATAVEKILMNLIGNSLKFTPAGGTIRVIGEAAGDGVWIRVKDSGIGIPKDKLDTVFDRFAQVDGSATRSYEGTGIGLSLARELAQLHGGDVHAESEGLGQGTTMAVFLPIGESDLEVVEQSHSIDAKNTLGMGHSIESVEAELNLEGPTGPYERDHDFDNIVERWEDRAGAEVSDRSGVAGCNDGLEADGRSEILIAEDNPDMRNLLATLLGREFRVRTARNGREALDLIGQSMPDLVLSDVMMPEMSGIELCREVRLNQETNSLPVVLVTSKAEQEMRAEGLELGADDYITKPFHPRELMARVRTLVRVRRLQRELAKQNERLQSTLDELKQAEVQLVVSERLAAVGEIAAGIAHEVNNPVNYALNAARAIEFELEGIESFTKAVEKASEANSNAQFPDAGELTKLHDLSSAIAELSKIVQAGLERTQSLVADLRDFAAPGRTNGQTPDTNLENGLHSTLQLLGPALSDANALVTVEVQERLPWVHADLGAINQVFLNLLKNALDAFDGKGGEINIRARHDEREITIEIEDNGVGIPDEMISQIFAPFVTTKEAGKGTGLGLSISRKIVEGHGGSLEVRRAASGGSIFVVTLPTAS